MEATEWIIVLVVVLVVAAIAAWLVTQQRKKKQQEHAEHLRQEAHEHATEIPETEMRAKEAEAQAERSRLEAERAEEQAREAQVAATQQQAVHEDRLRTADKVDPDVDTTSDDYAPGAGATDRRTVLDADPADRMDRTDDSGETHRH